MAAIIEKRSPVKVSDINLNPRGNVQKSPATWRDQIIYFLLPDRFSDGKEQEREMFDWKNPDKFKTNNISEWKESGKKFQGNHGDKLNGIKSKLDYLKELGITTIWLAPIFQQRPDLETYHGYGIQNFLEIDPRFGTRQDLRDLVDEAHNRNMYILLDIIYNHTGNNWFYDENGTAKNIVNYRYQPPYPFHGWHSENGKSKKNIDTINDGVWPKEFQKEEYYTRAGAINKMDPESWEDPLHPETQFRRGDFFDLKDLDYSSDEIKNKILSDIIKVYQYWIAVSDCDGMRIDTVKHVPWEVSRNFCGAIHEYTESIGKENFLLIGEVTGGEKMAKDYLEIFGRNIDAVLDIGEPAKRLIGFVKGLNDPKDFFNQYSGHELLGSHRETGRYHVSIEDDHDMVSREKKQRFAANNQIPNKYLQSAHAVGVQLTTIGIPCIYYGTEQAFNGDEEKYNDGSGFEDRYIRESMFGSTFGAFETSGCHFFNRNHPTYIRISAIAKVRNRQDNIGLALRRGRQYLRETSFLNQPFSFPGAGELVAWSRVLFDKEVLVVLNTHGSEKRGAHITIDATFHSIGSKMNYLYKGDWEEWQFSNPQQNEMVSVDYREGSNGRATVWIELPPAGMNILA